jgi:hypothetical protein
MAGSTQVAAEHHPLTSDVDDGHRGAQDVAGALQRHDHSSERPWFTEGHRVQALERPLDV